MRMCVGCGQMKQKSELIRVVKTPDGEVMLDKTGKQNGRGAYICKKSECLQKAEKINALARAFEMNIGADIYERLRGELSEVE